ncbi:MAG: hypothetical protein DRH24_08555 [Deltaproteobacteria bacterium]|nr:MAG: hypothetical protein DRH24_08555 [Deltaproteobacteria bacterium]
MGAIRRKLKVDDAAVLGFIINNIRGEGLSDQTIFYFEGGSVRSTKPATPTTLRGDNTFRQLRSLPPMERYTGEMIVNRQGGEVKNIEFHTVV